MINLNEIALVTYFTSRHVQKRPNVISILVYIWWNLCFISSARQTRSI
jgi:hypothetical protein